jgi:rod shape-determining protein MreC
MRKLILFLVRYNTAILFLLLQVLAFFVIYQTRSYQRSSMYALNAEWSGKTIELYNNIDDYINLSRINKNLARENANLKSANKDAYFSLTARKDTIVDSLYELQYEYIEARVINSSFSKRNNYITINKGSVHGLKPDMAVTSIDGVVGIVKDVSKHFATVIPLIHGRSLLGVGFRNSNFFGSMSWNGKDYRLAQITDVPREARLQVGDTIVSNTRALALPGNLMVGTIESFELDPENQTYNIEVKLAVNYAALDFVYVIDNVFKTEQLDLESENEE